MFRQFVQESEEGLALTDKQPIILEERDGSFRTGLLGQDGPNHGAEGQVRVDKLTGRGKYLISVVRAGIIGAVGRIG